MLIHEIQEPFDGAIRITSGFDTLLRHIDNSLGLAGREITMPAILRGNRVGTEPPGYECRGDGRSGCDPKHTQTRVHIRSKIRHLTVARGVSPHLVQLLHEYLHVDFRCGRAYRRFDLADFRGR